MSKQTYNKEVKQNRGQAFSIGFEVGGESAEVDSRADILFTLFA